MPTYDFKCGCGHVFDEIVAVGTQKTECPKCGKVAKRTISTTFGIEFRGGGFYKTGN